MSVTEQLDHIQREYPEAWAFINQMLDNERDSFVDYELPKFDDNDEIIKEDNNARDYDKRVADVG